VFSVCSLSRARAEEKEEDVSFAFPAILIQAFFFSFVRFLICLLWNCAGGKITRFSLFLDFTIFGGGQVLHSSHTQKKASLSCWGNF
jgi:hypothetical protein